MLCQTKPLFIGLFLVSFLFIAGLLQAAPNEIVSIEGEQILMDNEEGFILATQNVIVRYKNYTITSNEVEYRLDNRQLIFPEEFHLQKFGQEVETDSLEYTFSSLEGHAEHLHAKADRLQIDGEHVTFSPQNITIKNASFTTCPAPNRHYTVKAETIYLYPQWGFFVALHNRVEAAFLPFPIYIPTFIYGSRSYALVGSSTVIPDVGKNNREGWYIKQKFGYFQDRRSTGTINAGFTEKLGPLIGFNHGLILTDAHQLNFRAHYVGSEGIEGGATYIIDIGHNNIAESRNSLLEDLLLNFSAARQLPASRLSIHWQHRELINDSRVNFSPLVGLEVQPIKVLKTKLQISSRLSAGKIGEEVVLNGTDTFKQLWKGNFDGTIKYPVSLSKTLVFEPQLTYLGNWYSDVTTWQRLFSQFSLNWDLEFLQPRLFFTKRLGRNGGSPFEFENKYAVVSDEIGGELTTEIGGTEVRIRADYDLEVEKLRSLEFKGTFVFHCWKISLIINTQQNYIGFGVDLY
ncbi:MAG: lipopolysaccharide export system protein LptA [Candidatus Marinamargulisbacteria bacterium]|jgi:lipopolysaccharide export system protein LptA